VVYAFCGCAFSFSVLSWLISSSPIYSSREQKGDESANRDEEGRKQEDEYGASLKGAGEG
jgi:hypothetical protein